MIVPLSPTSDGRVWDIQLVTIAMVLSTAPIFNMGTLILTHTHSYTRKKKSGWLSHTVQTVDSSHANNSRYTTLCYRQNVVYTLNSFQLKNPKSVFFYETATRVVPLLKSPFLLCRKLENKSRSMSYSGCLHVNTHQVQTSKHPAQAAGDAPGNSWFGPTELCAFPGLLPSSGSKMLWLSQHCSHIYPLTLCLSLPPPCFSPSLSLCQTHYSISPSHSCAHLFSQLLHQRSTFS